MRPSSPPLRLSAWTLMARQSPTSKQDEVGGPHKVSDVVPIPALRARMSAIMGSTGMELCDGIHVRVLSCSAADTVEIVNIGFFATLRACDAHVRLTPSLGRAFRVDVPNGPPPDFILPELHPLDLAGGGGGGQ